MSKPANTAEKHSEKPVEKTTEKKEAHSPSGEAKDTSKKSSKGGHNPLPGGCFSWGCKAQASRFTFCDEHFDHFKFGLIKKTGEPVSDYEKKIEHYQASIKAHKHAQKVA